MIEEILPAPAATAEAFEDDNNPLFAEEEAIVGRAVEKRRQEFTTGRTCARRALAQLGQPATPIPSGNKGEPLWPQGVVGSITHCDGYRAAAVARMTELTTVGIDAEPHGPLPTGLIGDIGHPEEIAQLAALSRQDPTVHWDRLLFSAKESVYKAWFPLAKRWLGFEDAMLTIDTGTQSFAARLLVTGPTIGTNQLEGFEGRYLVRGGILVTAIALTAA